MVCSGLKSKAQGASGRVSWRKQLLIGNILKGGNLNTTDLGNLPETLMKLEKNFGDDSIRLLSQSHNEKRTQLIANAFR